MDTKALANATIAGTVLQLVMVVSGHFVPFIALHVFMWGGMGISALAGFLYGRGVEGTWRRRNRRRGCGRGLRGDRHRGLGRPG